MRNYTPLPMPDTKIHIYPDLQHKPLIKRRKNKTRPTRTHPQDSKRTKTARQRIRTKNKWNRTIKAPSGTLPLSTKQTTDRYETENLKNRNGRTCPRAAILQPLVAARRRRKQGVQNNERGNRRPDTDARIQRRAERPASLSLIHI